VIETEEERERERDRKGKRLREKRITFGTRTTIHEPLV